jgi:bifunctional DNA-binding transcriptional regulator/antitoxin component of YhaV-PrlF toxin-antitoxin module
MTRSQEDRRVYGPRRISEARQVALPKELMEEMGIEVGDSLFILAWREHLLLVREDEVARELDRLFAPLESADPKRIRNR